jgi:hypothetical protein
LEWARWLYQLDDGRSLLVAETATGPAIVRLEVG